MSMPATVQASITVAGDPAVATQTMGRVGTTVFYFGFVGSFVSGTLTKPGGTYRLFINNPGSLAPFPDAFEIPKTDSDPGNPVGTYSGTVDGKAITAQVAPV